MMSTSLSNLANSLVVQPLTQNKKEKISDSQLLNSTSVKSNKRIQVVMKTPSVLSKPSPLRVVGESNSSVSKMAFVPHYTG